MKSAIDHSSSSRYVILPRLGLLILLCAAVLLSGCKSYGPIGTPDFDPAYSRTLEKNEQLLFSAQTEFVDGTFMEGEEKSYRSYMGVLLLTNERMMFARWNEQQQRYEPAFWTDYPLISQVKMHNNLLLQYIAIITSDGRKFTYRLDKKSTDPAYAILMEQIRYHHQITMPAA